jgi:OMF family outer membrane factor
MGSAVAFATSLNEWEIYSMEMSVRPEILKERESLSSEVWPHSLTATLPESKSQLQLFEQFGAEPTLSPEDRAELAQSLVDVRLRVKSQARLLEEGHQFLMSQSVYRSWTLPKNSEHVQSQIELETSQTPIVQEPVITSQTALVAQEPVITPQTALVAQEPVITPQTAPVAQEPVITPQTAPVAQEPVITPQTAPDNSIVFPSSDPLRPSAQPLAQPNPLALPQLPKNPAPNQVNPMGNPLLFPTKPGEVKTNIRQAITLNQAIELALQNNPQLQAARIELLREEAGLMVARSALFPILSTEFSLSRDSSPAAQFQNELAAQNAQQQGGTPNLQRETSTNAVGTVQLVYNIYTGGERGAQIARAEKQVRNGQLQVEVIAEQTRFDATDRYYALQGADAQVAIAQATVEDTSQSLRDARLLEQAGLGTRFDVLRAEGDLATANEALTRSIADQRNARRRLAQILNVGQQVELTAADEIQEAGDWSLPLEQSIVQAFKNRAELEQRLVQSEISEQDSLIALAAIKPQVDFLANYDYQNNFDSSAGVVDGYSFAARVRWTFFDGGRAFAQARRAYREMDLAQTQFAQQRDQIRFDVEESYYNLIANKENISSTRTNVVRFEEALRLARLRFQAGVGTQTDVINAQRDLANARGRFLQAIIGYNQSLNSLQRAVSNLPNNTLFTVQP